MPEEIGGLTHALNISRNTFDADAADGVLSLACAFLLFCAQPKWLWAVFAGLEGPLAGVLVLTLAERLLARAPAWQASVAAALLVTTRPETMLVAFALPLLATRAEGRRPFAPRLAFAYAAARATLALLVLPCWVRTGRVFPSSLGTRVHLTALLEPGGVTRYLERVLSQPAYWQAEWWTASLALLLVAGDWVNERQHVRLALTKFVNRTGERRVAVDPVK